MSGCYNSTLSTTISIIMNMCGTIYTLNNVIWAEKLHHAHLSEKTGPAVFSVFFGHFEDISSLPSHWIIRTCVCITGHFTVHNILIYCDVLDSTAYNHNEYKRPLLFKHTLVPRNTPPPSKQPPPTPHAHACPSLHHSPPTWIWESSLSICEIHFKAQMAPMTFQTTIPHKPWQVKWGEVHASVVTEWPNTRLHKSSPRGHQTGSYGKPRIDEVPNLVNIFPTTPIEVSNLHDFFKIVCLSTMLNFWQKRMLVLMSHIKDRMSTRDTANKGNSKANRVCPPLTAKGISADCVKNSVRSSVQYIPLGVYHTGGLKLCLCYFDPSNLCKIYVKSYIQISYQTGWFTEISRGNQA